jgi:hypothetical protein
MRAPAILLFGDALAIALLTVIGFATHENLQDVTRMPTTFIPALVAWLAIAPFFGLYKPEITRDPRQLWRPAYVAILAAPLMTILRGFMLNSIAIPLFAAVFAATAALGMVIWRGAWWAWQSRQ